MILLSGVAVDHGSKGFILLKKLCLINISAISTFCKDDFPAKVIRNLDHKDCGRRFFRFGVLASSF
jgi:hypothetical protein